MGEFQFLCLFTPAEGSHWQDTGATWQIIPENMGLEHWTTPSERPGFTSSVTHLTGQVAIAQPSLSQRAVVRIKCDKRTL